MKNTLKKDSLISMSSIEDSIISDSSDYPQKDTTRRNLSPETRKGLLVSLSIFFLGFIIIDFFIHRKFMKLSCELTMHLQSILGRFGFILSWIFSYPVTFIVVPPITLHCVYTKSYSTTVYYYLLFFGQMHLVVFLKGSYGRGRPIIIGEYIQAEHCSCDYGMPSGHSSSSLAGYYIIMDMLVRGSKLKATDKRKVLSFIWISISFLVGASRIVYGVHSLSQIICGYLISAVIILALTEEGVKESLKRANPKTVKRIGILLYFLSAVSIVSLYFINRKRKQDRSWWKYWERCEKCKETFANTQLVNLSSLFMFPGIVYGIGVNLESSYQAESPMLKKKKYFMIRRLGILLSATGVIAMLSLVVSLVIIPIKFKEDEKPFIFRSVLLALSMSLLSILLTAFGPILLNKFELSSESDFYFSSRANLNASSDHLEEQE